MVRRGNSGRKGGRRPVGVFGCRSVAETAGDAGARLDRNGSGARAPAVSLAAVEGRRRVGGPRRCWQLGNSASWGFTGGSGDGGGPVAGGDGKASIGRGFTWKQRTLYQPISGSKGEVMEEQQSPLKDSTVVLWLLEMPMEGGQQGEHPDGMAGGEAGLAEKTVGQLEMPRHGCAWLKRMIGEVLRVEYFGVDWSAAS